MPLQNRVHPDGSLHAIAQRGSMMGNRGGQIHDPETQALKRGQPWVSRAWICCVLDFKNRQRQVWGQSYTELFFLDEVTALTAGHRPCFECRRKDALAFQQALFRGLGASEGWASPPKAPQMDCVLRKSRTRKETAFSKLSALPIGAIFEAQTAAGPVLLAKAETAFLRWSWDGYSRWEGYLESETVRVSTPPAMLAALQSGYEPEWHATAFNKD